MKYRQFTGITPHVYTNQHHRYGVLTQQCYTVVPQADRSGGGTVSTAVCVFVCISKSDTARITGLDKEMFHTPWVLKTSLFWGQEVKVTRHKNIAGVGVYTLVSSGFLKYYFVQRIV